MNISRLIELTMTSPHQLWVVFGSLILGLALYWLQRSMRWSELASTLVTLFSLLCLSLVLLLMSGSAGTAQYKEPWHFYVGAKVFWLYPTLIFLWAGGVVGLRIGRSLSGTLMHQPSIAKKEE